MLEYIILKYNKQKYTITIHTLMTMVRINKTILLILWIHFVNFYLWLFCAFNIGLYFIIYFRPWPKKLKFKEMSKINWGKKNSIQNNSHWFFCLKLQYYWTEMKFSNDKFLWKNVDFTFFLPPPHNFVLL